VPLTVTTNAEYGLSASSYRTPHRNVTDEQENANELNGATMIFFPHIHPSLTVTSTLP